MPDTACYRILVAVETDATRYHGSGPSRPRLLGRPETDQLLSHLAADLNALIPAAAGCWLAAPGAVLDLTQVLRPGYPAFQALADVACGPGRGGAGVGIAARDGALEPAALQPEADIPLGILQLLPVLVCGPAGTVARIGGEMEHVFLEKGQLSPHTARWMEGAFGIVVRHGRFMTLSDLGAMFRLQLEHFGFLPLWELIDAALCERAEPLEVCTDDGQWFRWQGSAVHTEFQTFDYWATAGLGRQVEAARGRLAGRYADWTRQLRQFLTTLTAHRVAIRFHLPDRGDQAIPGSFFFEPAGKAPPHSASITEHSFSELGTVCVTTVHGGRLAHYYPLTAGGLNDIHRAIRDEHPIRGAVAYPGTILYDPVSRKLTPERDDPAPRNRAT